MEANKEEALKAKEIAEKRFFEKDFSGAKNYALKAKTLYPGLEGISQMVATFDVYIASEVTFNGEVDYYSILGLKPFADKDAVKKQYRKMAVLLHPDKNKCVGADGAFKLVSEAWTLLSDNAKKRSYDHQRNKQQSTTVVNQTSLSSVHAGGVTGFNNCSNPPASHGRLDTFWTICTSCKVQYEYLRKYVNKRLSCKNCRGVFIAVETGTAPATGSFPYTPWSYVPSNGYPSHGYDGVTYVPSSATFFSGNGVSGFHSGHGYEYVSNVSFQWSSFSGTSVGVMGPTGPSSMTPDGIYNAHGSANLAGVKEKSRANGKRSMKSIGDNANSYLSTGFNESPGPKVGRPDKKRKVVVGSSFRNGSQDAVPKPALETILENGNVSIGQDPKLSCSVEVPNRRCSAAPAFDARKLLIEKARTEILKKLEEMKLVAAAETATKNPKAQSEVGQTVVAKEAKTRLDSDGTGRQLNGKTAPLSINVPDPDFHDFDKDRAEECFKPKQIWALYDEEDGMPRLYCLIREVISVKPFKILITYLNSKTDTEFGIVNWLDCGFTKSCGNFRAWTSDVVEQVNIFSHVLSREKAGRGGCVRIYPRSGDIWAVYRNWSPDWNRSTPDEVRHQYEMVEILDDYSEELGVCVSPLVKVAGFKTVYGRNSDKGVIRWIPRREMVRFSHQVPSWLLKREEGDLPEKCWDLDPAAIPDELLHTAAEQAEAA